MEVSKAAGDLTIHEGAYWNVGTAYQVGIYTFIPLIGYHRTLVGK